MYNPTTQYNTDFYKDFRNNSFCNISLAIQENAPRGDSLLCTNVPKTDWSEAIPWTSNVPPLLSIASLEGDRLKLDGSLSVFNTNSFLNIALVLTPLSNSNGQFTTNPIITLTYGTNYSYMALTLLFDEYSKEYAIDFDIKAYNGGTLLDTKVVTNNTNYRYEYVHNYNNITKITIEFKKVLPYHRARLSYITYGIEKNWTNDDLMEQGLIYINKVDPLSRELPENSIDFTVNNYENLYNPDNPDGIYKYLHENMEIYAKIGYMLDNNLIEWIPLGKFYLNEWSADDYTAKFKGIGLLNTLNKIYLEEAPITTVIENVSLSSKLNQLIMFEGLDMNITYDDILNDIYTTAPFPGVSVAETLQYIANSSNCILYTDRENIIHIEPYSNTTYTLKIDNDMSEEDGRMLELEPVLKNISCKWYRYVIGDQKTVYTGSMDVSDVVITSIYLNKPAQNISVDVIGAELLTYVAGYMRVDIVLYSEYPDSAVITISGREIESMEQEYIENVNTNGEDAEINNTIITNTEVASDISIYTKNILTKRNKYKITYRGSPEVDACDKILLDTKFSEDLTFLVTSNKIIFKGGITGELEGRVI